MRFTSTASVLATACAVASTSAITLNTNDQTSIKDAAAVAAGNLMKYYTNGGPEVDPFLKGRFFPRPNYWWNSGAIWGGIIDYTTLTSDTQYASTVAEAIYANTGDYNAFMRSDLRAQMGNDDQLFWILACLGAAESSLPVPSANASGPSYLDLAVNGWNDVRARWNTETCGGGYKWQHFPENNGFHYKNAINNGAMFQLSARLAKATGNETYTQHAEEIYNWVTSTNLIGPNFEVFDGHDELTDCKSTDKGQWLYNNGVFLYGTSLMYSLTTDTKWLERSQGLLTHAQSNFVRDGVLVESNCETVEGRNCNEDQASHKGLWARWAGKAALLVPELAGSVLPLIEASAEGAAKACAGPDNTCSLKWFTGSFELLATGPNQEMSAMEVFTALLALKFGGQSPAPTPEPTLPEPSAVPEVVASVVASIVIPKSEGANFAEGAEPTLSPEKPSYDAPIDTPAAEATPTSIFSPEQPNYAVPIETPTAAEPTPTSILSPETPIAENPATTPCSTLAPWGTPVFPADTPISPSSAAIDISDATPVSTVDPIASSLAVEAPGATSLPAEGTPVPMPSVVSVDFPSPSAKEEVCVPTTITVTNTFYETDIPGETAVPSSVGVEVPPVGTEGSAVSTNIPIETEVPASSIQIPGETAIPSIITPPVVVPGSSQPPFPTSLIVDTQVPGQSIPGIPIGTGTRPIASGSFTAPPVATFTGAASSNMKMGGMMVGVVGMVGMLVL